MRYSNRLFLYAPFVILLIIAAAAMLRWRQITNDWQVKLLAANNGHEIAPGITLHFASEKIGGFPFNVDLVLNNLVVAVKSMHGPISLRSEHFAIHALTYGRKQQVMEAAGLQTLTWTNAEGVTHRFAFTPGSLRASAIESKRELTRFDLDIETFGSRQLTCARAQLHIRKAPDADRLEFKISADDLRVPHRSAVLSRAYAVGRIAPATPLSRLLSADDQLLRALTYWRSSDGRLRLDRAVVRWDTTSLLTSGALTLDDNYRLGGHLDMDVLPTRGWKPTLLSETPFTTTLQQLTDEFSKTRAPLASLLLSLDIHNGAAIVMSARIELLPVWMTPG